MTAKTLVSTPATTIGNPNLENINNYINRGYAPTGNMQAVGGSAIDTVLTSINTLSKIGGENNFYKDTQGYLDQYSNIYDTQHPVGSFLGNTIGYGLTAAATGEGALVKGIASGLSKVGDAVYAYKAGKAVMDAKGVATGLQAGKSAISLGVGSTGTNYLTSEGNVKDTLELDAFNGALGGLFVGGSKIYQAFKAQNKHTVGMIGEAIGDDNIVNQSQDILSSASVGDVVNQNMFKAPNEPLTFDDKPLVRNTDNSPITLNDLNATDKEVQDFKDGVSNDLNNRPFKVNDVDPIIKEADEAQQNKILQNVKSSLSPKEIQQYVNTHTESIDEINANHDEVKQYLECMSGK